MIKKVLSASAILAFAVASAAQATTPSNSKDFNVGAIVQAQCTINSTSDLNFGTLPAGDVSAPITGSGGAINYSCSAGLTPDLSLLDKTNGSSNGATAANFILANTAVTPSSFVAYTIADATTNAPIGNSALSGAATDPLSTSNTTVNLAGSILANQTLVAGTYADVVTATINY